MSNAHILAAQKLFQGMTGKAPVHLKAGRCAAKKGVAPGEQQTWLCFRSPCAVPGGETGEPYLSSCSWPHVLTCPPVCCTPQR